MTTTVEVPAKTPAVYVCEELPYMVLAHYQGLFGQWREGLTVGRPWNSAILLQQRHMITGVGGVFLYWLVNIIHSKL